jgi:hypothetical protein
MRPSTILDTTAEVQPATPSGRLGPGKTIRLDGPNEVPAAETASLPPSLVADPVEATALRPPPEAADEAITIEAKVDVGYGNAVFIRGEGAGLRWDKGTPLACVDGTTWVWSTRAGAAQVRFKLLLNDAVWCHGEDLMADAGRRTEVTPSFG